jgi:hypothetical protein
VIDVMQSVCMHQQQIASRHRRSPQSRLARDPASPVDRVAMVLAGEVGDLAEVAHGKLRRNRDRFPPGDVWGRADLPPAPD